MTNVFTKLILLAAFVARPTLAAEPVTMVHEGVTYHYTIENEGNTQILTGAVDRGETFRLVVANGRVSGMVGNRPVSFAVREAVGSSRLKGQSIATR